MALAEVMQAIEQYRFSAEVNLAAGTKAFRRDVRNHHLFRELADLAKEPQVRSEIAERVAALSRAEIDRRYENRFDAALSAYLTILGDTAEPELIAEAASSAASAPNCWWTVGISREVLMHAIATGYVRSAPVVYLDARALAPDAPWKETTAEGLPKWFNQPKTDSSVETRRVLRVLTDAQSTGQHGSSVLAPAPENDQLIISLNFRRRNKKRQLPPNRGTLIRHGSRLAYAS